MQIISIFECFKILVKLLYNNLKGKVRFFIFNKPNFLSEAELVTTLDKPSLGLG